MPLQLISVQETNCDLHFWKNGFLWAILLYSHLRDFILLISPYRDSVLFFFYHAISLHIFIFAVRLAYLIFFAVRQFKRYISWKKTWQLFKDFELNFTSYFWFDFFLFKSLLFFTDSSNFIHKSNRWYRARDSVFISGPSDPDFDLRKEKAWVKMCGVDFHISSETYVRATIFWNYLFDPLTGVLHDVLHSYNVQHEPPCTPRCQHLPGLQQCQGLLHLW